MTAKFPGIESDARRLPFSGALVVAVLIEALALAAALTLGLEHHSEMAAAVRRKPMAVHFVALPRPPAPPKVQPRVIPKPRPIQKPVPKPVPRPIIHHRPVPLPKPVKPIAPKVIRPAPPALPPVPVPTPSSPTVVAHAVARYANLLRLRIQRRLVVPARVTALGLSGKAVIAFKLNPSGRLVWARIWRSSGVRMIDQASLAAVKSHHFSPFSHKMPHHPLVFHIRVGLDGHGNRF